MHSSVANMSTERRYDLAIAKVLDDGWTQSETAKHYGINRSHLNQRVKAAKQERLDAEVRAAEDFLRARQPIVREERRVGTFQEFFQNYFGSWICPDCQVHHELPEFHDEIINAIESDANRVLINLPPYHSKSTLVTVWHTAYDIARNPNSRTIIVSKSAPFAKSFNHAIKDILSVEELYASSNRNLVQDWGPFMPNSGGWSEYEIYVKNRTGAEKDPTVLSMGYGGQIYGRRADRIKFDDVATLENQRNPDRVQQMREWMDKEALSRIGKSGQAIWAGTRVAPGDIYSILQQRAGYHVIRYPALMDEEEERVLWPEHFPFSQVMTHKGEMSPADFQLVYQNVDVPGLNASFTPEMMDEAKDVNRQTGHWADGWRLIAGLDPAGANKGSGYTAMVLLAVDLNTGHRFVVDAIAEKAMKAPRMKQLMFEWTDRYPIYEWRVESNGVQSQLVQYNEEVMQHLAKRGVRVVPHQTHGNKWDAEFGVESIAPLFSQKLVSIPWAGRSTAQNFQRMIEEFISFPMGVTSDLVMAFWFAELGIREILNRAHMPMFNDRLRRKWPKRIRSRAKIVNFEERTVTPVPLRDQRAGHLTVGQQGYRRMTAGVPSRHDQVREYEADEPEGPMNIDPNIWNPPPKDDASRATL
jgi:hypothetical protein